MPEIKRLAVIPSDPLRDYEDKGLTDREEYYNPGGFFDEVYLISPLEKTAEKKYGMSVVPTPRKAFRRRLKELEIDVVRAYGGYWPCDLATLNKVSDVPVVVSVHDTNRELLHPTVRFADVVFSMSGEVGALVGQYLTDHDRIWLLGNRVDFSVHRPRPPEEWAELRARYPFRHLILHIGRKTPQKNQDTLIRALALLGPDYGALFVGRGDQATYERLASDLGVGDRCRFLDSVPNPDLALYYSMADVMCTPSRWEGFGVVFVEALACGAAVVTSDIAPINEYVRHEENGLLVKKYEDPAALAGAISRVNGDAVLRDGIRSRARESVRQFEKSAIDRREASFYGRVLAMRDTGAFYRPWWKEWL